MFTEIQSLLDENYDEMVSIRRYLHENPELTFKEYKTAKYIADFYANLNIPFEENVGGNGVVATLKGGKPGKTVALRADFDALPIQDQKEVSYKSKVPGVMHACGHDGHTASLLVLAKVVKEFQADLPGTIIFVHQHAEEIPPGITHAIIKSGMLYNNYAIYSNHLWSLTDLGNIETRVASSMARADSFNIKIKVTRGHRAYPHQTQDSIVIEAELVSQL